MELLGLLIVWSIAFTLAAVVLTFVYAMDAASAMGDGMILAILVLAWPLWPISMPFWVLYLLGRHRDARARALRPSPDGQRSNRPALRSVPYGQTGPNVAIVIPDDGPTAECLKCGTSQWNQLNQVRARFGAVGACFRCQRCEASRNFNIIGDGWEPTFPPQ